MTTNPLKFLELFHDAELEFLVVGGVAMRLWGSTRLTHDLDIAPVLNADSWRKAVQIVVDAGAHPRIPEPIERIADLENVQQWRTEKNLQAVTFRSRDQSAEVDFLIDPDLDLEGMLARATVIELDGRRFKIAAIEDLIAMKHSAGRPQDLLDIEELCMIRDRIQE